MDHVVENSLLRCDDTNRRRWLIATSIVGGAGGIATIVPFVDSFAPSEKARAAGASVSVDLSQIAPGTMTTVAWRGMPVFVVNRTERMLKEVVEANEMVLDPFSTHPFTMPLPTYCTNQYRSRVTHPNFLVVMGVCTHLGCTPSLRFQSGPQPICQMTGPADSCALATDRPTISRVGYLKINPLHKTSTCRASSLIHPSSCRSVRTSTETPETVLHIRAASASLKEGSTSANPFDVMVTQIHRRIVNSRHPDPQVSVATVMVRTVRYLAHHLGTAGFKNTMLRAMNTTPQIISSTTCS